MSSIARAQRHQKNPELQGEEIIWSSFLKHFYHCLRSFYNLFRSFFLSLSLSLHLSSRVPSFVLNKIFLFVASFFHWISFQLFSSLSWCPLLNCRTFLVFFTFVFLSIRCLCFFPIVSLSLFLQSKTRTRAPVWLTKWWQVSSDDLSWLIWSRRKRWKTTFHSTCSKWD